MLSLFKLSRLDSTCSHSMVHRVTLGLSGRAKQHKSVLGLRASGLDVAKVEAQFECSLKQNTEATNLAKVLEVLWLSITECIEQKKSIVLYFDSCSVRDQKRKEEKTLRERKGSRKKWVFAFRESGPVEIDTRRLPSGGTVTTYFCTEI